MMHNSPFTVAGMSTSTSTHHHSPSFNTWGSTTTSGQLSSSFTDTLSQSRSHYQPGYLMSSQSNNAPQGNQRIDEVPIVQTKAKMNQILTRGSTSDFGMDSMFESTRQRQKLIDEDAPPTNSVNDIPNEVNHTPSPHYQPRNSSIQDLPSFARRAPRPAPSTPQPGQQQPLYIVVFGYPADKYSLTVEYFQSLGAATDPDPHLEIQNCFRIGFTDPGDALRAVRKNGEVLGGSWMVGTKWADPAHAEALLGQSTAPSHPVPDSTSSGSNAMSIDEPTSPPSSSSPQKGAAAAAAAASYKYGTPLKLVPSSAAFRKHDATPQQPQPQRGWGPMMPVPAAQQQQQPMQQQMQPPPSAGSPSKGMLGQVSDLIFGW
ncbi:hypothetical protein D9615_006635 [Tricholomella constricta]|uniref:RRM Nup35-type domain-containing protein n=1 Tax=Tricholomella constricta TaxID=117010 RepID=A0A8H5HA47_9AGAR|nr:hypothetical protein D9615_006635 [Tricholomella constricta]